MLKLIRETKVLSALRWFEKGQNRRNSLYFPCLTAILMPESSSSETAPSAIQSIVFMYNSEMARNPRVARGLCASCAPENASPAPDSANFWGLSPGAEKPGRLTVRGQIRQSIAFLEGGRSRLLVDADRLKLRWPLKRQIDSVEQGLGTQFSGLSSLADCFDDARCGEGQAR